MPDNASSGDSTEESTGDSAATEQAPADSGAAGSASEQRDAEVVTAADDDEPGVPAPVAPAAPEAPRPVDAGAERGQRRITREAHTTTTRSHSETTTHETTTTVEDIAVAPPVYAAPASEHPRPVG